MLVFSKRASLVVQNFRDHVDKKQLKRRAHSACSSLWTQHTLVANTCQARSCSCTRARAETPRAMLKLPKHQDFMRRKQTKIGFESSLCVGSQSAHQCSHLRDSPVPMGCFSRDQLEDAQNCDVRRRDAAPTDGDMCHHGHHRRFGGEQRRKRSASISPLFSKEQNNNSGSFAAQNHRAARRRLSKCAGVTTRVAAFLLQLKALDDPVGIGIPICLLPIVQGPASL